MWGQQQSGSESPLAFAKVGAGGGALKEDCALGLTRLVSMRHPGGPPLPRPKPLDVYAPPTPRSPSSCLLPLPPSSRSHPSPWPSLTDTLPLDQGQPVQHQPRDGRVGPIRTRNSHGALRARGRRQAGRILHDGSQVRCNGTQL